MTPLRAIGTTAAAVLLLSIEGQAHRLDEYLQAARLSLAPERVALELDLTPGVAVASEIIALIDRDADATISSEEARTYGQRVLSEVRLTLDDGPVAVTLHRVEVASAADLRAGLGTIAVRGSGAVDRLGAGRHTLQFQNNHHPAGAAYLINALAPNDPAIRVVSQRRDPIQREGLIEYEIRSSPAARWLWLFAGALVCLHRPIAARLRRQDGV